MNKTSIRKRATEILDAAAEIFAQKGYHGASTKDIAERLGIQQAGVYYYFKSKDAALAEVCQIGGAGFVEASQEILQSDVSAEQQIRHAIAAHLSPFRERRHYNLVFINERRYLLGGNRRRVWGLARRYEKNIQKIFENGVAEGLFRPETEPQIAAQAMLAMCNSMFVWQHGRALSEIETIATAYGDIMLRGVMV